jgi:3-dehydroquinate dehydratase I
MPARQKCFYRILVVLNLLIFSVSCCDPVVINKSEGKDDMPPRQKVQIGSCTLGAIPRTLAIIDDTLPMQEIKKLKEIGVDLFEIRIDSFNDSIETILKYAAKVKDTVSIPLIGTIRENAWTKKNRLELFAKVIPSVDAIDIEIDADIAKPVIEMAAKAKKTIIVSEHDFNGTPTDAELDKIVRKAAGLGCDIVKIAALARSKSDVVRLLECIHRSKTPIVGFSMGEYGAISRVLSMFFGSLYSYGYVKKANAPGQIQIGKLIEEIRKYYPDYNSNKK